MIKEAQQVITRQIGCLSSSPLLLLYIYIIINVITLCKFIKLQNTVTVRIINKSNFLLTYES
jgi:hypothetical protein